MKKIALLTLIATLFACNLNAQQHVYPMPIDSGKTLKSNTFCYMLPTTAFKVTVTVAKIRELKGYYSEHAQSLLGLSNIITENKIYYKLRNVSIEPVQIPDQTQSYMVQPSSRQLKAGLLEQLTQEPFATTVNTKMQCYTTKSTPIPNFFKNYADISFTEQEDAFVETKIIDGVVTQVPANRTKVVNKTNLQKAQEAADAIVKSRKAQYTLATGENEAPYPAETIETMMQELKQWEENYLCLFKGLVLEDEITYTFIVDPATMAKMPAFCFTQANGLSFDNLSTGNANCYTLGFQPILNTISTSQAIEDCQKPLKENAQGYRYRNAQPMKVTLWQQNKEIYNFGNFEMSQYGRIQVLPLHQDDIDVHSIGFIF